MSRDRHPYSDAEFFEDDPLFGALRESDSAPDLSESVLEEVERRGFFTSVRMRRAIGLARIGAIALGLGMLGGVLIAKRYSPDAALFPVAQAPASSVLDEGCAKAARNAERFREILATEDGRRRLFELRGGGEGEGFTIAQRERLAVEPPSSAVVVALWSAPTDRRSGVACARSGALELWFDGSRAERIARLEAGGQALASRCPAAAASFDESVSAVLVADRPDRKR